MTKPIKLKNRSQLARLRKNLEQKPQYKHRLRRITMEPGKPDIHTAACGFQVKGAWESRAVRSVITISGEVTCPKCLEL